MILIETDKQLDKLARRCRKWWLVRRFFFAPLLTGHFCLLLLLACVNFACQQPSQTESPLSAASQMALDSSLWLQPTRGIRGIFEDAQGQLWFSSTDYVCKYDGQSVEYVKDEHGAAITGTMHQDQEGNLWLEDGFRIYRYDGKNFVLHPWREGNYPEQVLRDSNTIWFQKGIDLNDAQPLQPGILGFRQGEIAFFPFPGHFGAEDKFFYYPTTGAIYGKDGTIWFATMEQVFGFREGAFISLGREEMGRTEDPRAMGIRGLYVDHHGQLWIADNGAGIFVYDGQQVENFTQAHHLDDGDQPGNSLHRAFSIAEDTLSNMWFGTVYSGLWRYNPHTQELKNYGAEDGIHSDNIWTIYRTRDGTMLFAGESPAAVYTIVDEALVRVF